MSPELETLDQLLGGDLPLIIIKQLYADGAAFARGVQGLLDGGDVQLLSDDRVEVPRWQQHDILARPITTGFRHRATA
jgi:hypothetical protein